MERRAFLGGVGALASGGLLGRRLLASDDSLQVRVWRSDRAAAYDGLGERVRGYLEAALAPVDAEIGVSVAEGTVSLPAESGRAVLARRWPRLVVEGVAGTTDLDPTTGVNLLVTDGDPREQPAGYARPHVAAATGARYVARMDPADEVGETVPYSVATAATQLLLHEVGHALGLSHDHGRATATDEGVAASPMVGSYLWLPADDRQRYLAARNTCGETYPAPGTSGRRRLGLRYSPCAVAALLQR